MEMQRKLVLFGNGKDGITWAAFTLPGQLYPLLVSCTIVDISSLLFQNKHIFNKVVRQYCLMRYSAYVIYSYSKYGRKKCASNFLFAYSVSISFQMIRTVHSTRKKRNHFCISK